MSKLFQQAMRLEVEERQPIAFVYQERREKVKEILKQWRVVHGWWKRAVEREYLQVRTESGIVCEIYRDLLTGVWYLQRIYD